MESENQVALGPHSNSKYTLTLLEALLILSKASLSRTTDSLPPTVRDVFHKLNTAKLLQNIQSSSPDRKTAAKPTKYTSPDRKTKKRSSPRLSPDNYKESKTKKSPNLNFSKISSSNLKRLKPPRPHTQTYTIVKSPKIPLTIVKSSKSPSVDRNRKSRPSRSSNSRSKDKNREYLERQLSRTVDVCYMNNIKNCIEKLKANYNCNPYLCPVLRQRLHKHRIQYHPELFQDSGMMHECDYNSRNLMDGNEAQTKITLAKLGDLTISIETKPMSTNTSNSFVQEHQQKQQQDNTSRENTVWNDNYRIEVEREVRKWLTKIPFHPDDTENTKELKEESIKYLIDKIHSLNSASGEIDYDYEVKRYIDNCLEELSIWYPGTKRDRIVFKEGLRENLYIRIKDMNKNFFAKHEQPGSMDFNGSFRPDYTGSRNDARYDQYDPRNSMGQLRESSKQGIPTSNACCQRPANSRTSAMEEAGKKVNVTLHSDGKTSITVDSSPEGGQNYILEQPTKLSGAPTDRNINSIGNNYVIPSQNERKSYGGGTVGGDMYPQDGKYRQERPSTNSSKSYNDNPYVQNSGLGLENNYGKSQYREDPSRSYGANTGGESQTNRSGSVAADRRASIKNKNKNYGSNIPNGANFASNRANGNNNEGTRPDWQNNVPYRQDEMKGGPNRIDRTNGRYDKPNLGLGRSGETNHGKNYRSFDNSNARSSNYRPSNIDNARGPSTSSDCTNCRTSGLGGQADGSNNADRVSQGFNRSQLIPNTHLRAIKKESNDFARNSSPDRGNSSNSGKFRHIRNTSMPLQEKNRGQISNNHNVIRSKERRDKAKENTDYSDTNDTYYDEDSNKNYSKRKKSYTVIKKPKPFDENTDEDRNKYTGEDDDGHNRKKTKYKNIELKASDPSMKCTINSKDLCACPGDTVNLKKTKPICGPKVFDMEKEIADWLEKSSILKDNEVMSKRQVIGILLEHISSYMRQPYDNLHRAVLKSKIITVLKRLGLCSYASGKAKSELYKMAEELSNRLIGIQSRIECTGGGSWKCHLRKSSPFVGLEKIVIGPNEVCRIDLENDLMQEVKECLYNTKLTSNRDIEEDITQLLIERVELIRRDLLDTVEKDIYFILESADELEETEIINVTNCIIHYARELITYINNINDRTDFSKTISVNRVISGVPSIYTSEHEITTFNTTVTTPLLLDEGQLKQTHEEKVLADEIAAEINTWLTKVPENFIRSEESSMNKMIIYDLAGEIVNHIKMKQLGPDLDIDKKSFMSVYVYKWLMKFGMLENLNDAEPHTQALVKKLERINIPTLIKLPQTTDQVSQSKQMIIEKQQEGNTEDMIVHEITKWMNEQDPAIYKNDSENGLTNEAHEIAEKIKQSKSSKKRDSNVKSWLKRVINQNEHSKINYLSNSLIDRIEALPQNEMLDSKPEKKSKTLVSDHEKTSKTMVSNHERKTKQNYISFASFFRYSNNQVVL